MEDIFAVHGTVRHMNNPSLGVGYNDGMSKCGGSFPRIGATSNKQ